MNAIYKKKNINELEIALICNNYHNAQISTKKYTLPLLVDLKFKDWENSIPKLEHLRYMLELLVELFSPNLNLPPYLQAFLNFPIHVLTRKAS